jgi:hypothetical protein
LLYATGNFPVFLFSLCALLYAFIIKGGLSMDTGQAFVETLKVSRKKNHRNVTVIPLLASDHGDPDYLTQEEGMPPTHSIHFDGTHPSAPPRTILTFVE